MSYGAQTHSARQFLSDAVKAQWKTFLIWYESKHDEYRRLVDQQTKGEMSPEAVRATTTRLKENLVDAARTEWFHRLSQAGLRAEYWKVTPEEEASVSNVLGMNIDEAATPHVPQPLPKTKNNRLVENTFGPAAWLKWHTEAKKSSQLVLRQPATAGIAHFQSHTNPSVPHPPRSRVRSRSFSHGSPPVTSGFPSTDPMPHLYYVASLAPTPIKPSFTLSASEASEMDARLKPLLHHECEAKVREFYKGLCDATIQYQRRFINASLDLDIHGDPSKMEEVTMFARTHFDNDVRSLAFRKGTEVKETLSEEMLKLEKQFVRRRNEAADKERRKNEAAIEAESKKAHTRDKKPTKKPGKMSQGTSDNVFKQPRDSGRRSAEMNNEPTTKHDGWEAGGWGPEGTGGAGTKKAGGRGTGDTGGWDGGQSGGWASGGNGGRGTGDHDGWGVGNKGGSGAGDNGEWSAGDNGGWSAGDNGGWNAGDNGGWDTGGWNAGDNGGWNTGDNGGWSAGDNGGWNAGDGGGWGAGDNGGWGNASHNSHGFTSAENSNKPSKIIRKGRTTHNPRFHLPFFRGAG